MKTKTTEGIAKGTSLATFGGEVVELVWDLRWLIALAIILIIADFWYGISESRKREVSIRKSRAGRRTMNKFVDYICYLMVGGVLGMAIGEPLGVNHIAVAAVFMLLACIWEIDSIYGHICFLHGIEKKVSIKKLVLSLLKAKSKEVGEAVEQSMEDSKNEKD